MSRRPHRCPVDGCGRRFDTSRGLAVHLRWHARQEPPPAPARRIPDPPRPLMFAGLELWRRVHEVGDPSGELELLVLLCEQLDERSVLRGRVLQAGADPRDRSGLRLLEEQIARELRELGLSPLMPHDDSADVPDWTARLAAEG